MDLPEEEAAVLPRGEKQRPLAPGGQPCEARYERGVALEAPQARPRAGVQVEDGVGGMAGRGGRGGGCVCVWGGVCGVGFSLVMVDSID